MGIIKRDNVQGYQFEDEVICAKCFDQKTDGKELTENEIITDEAYDAGDDLRFCDRCKKQF